MVVGCSIFCVAGSVRYFDNRTISAERKLFRVSKQVSAAQKSQTRQALLDDVAMAVGAFRTATDIVDEAVAGAFAVNRTDLRLIQALQVSGQLTAGQLATRVGLSPAATTTAIGRLVAAGHATRTRNDSDRRQTIVSLTPSALAIGDQAFGVMVQAGRRLLRRYTQDQLLVIQDFMQKARQVEITHAENLSAANVP
jgi:DNA-binding MarR family transcriptional regulator